MTTPFLSAKGVTGKLRFPLRILLALALRLCGRRETASKGLSSLSGCVGGEKLLVNNGWNVHKAVLVVRCTLHLPHSLGMRLAPC